MLARNNFAVHRGGELLSILVCMVSLYRVRDWLARSMPLHGNIVLVETEETKLWNLCT